MSTTSKKLASTLHTTEPQTEPDDLKQDEDEKPPVKTQTCRHYKNNKCRFGISGKGCPYVHPKRCSHLMNHGTRAGKGCNKGNKCELFHPKMCPMSITKSECLDTSCTLCHVKGTRRQPLKSTKTEKVVPEEAEPEVDVSKAKANPAKPTATDNDLVDKSSFLDQINLLKRELQEAMDKKLESLIQMQSQQTLQQIPPMQFRPSPPHQQFAPIPWMHQYQMPRNPLFQMGY